MVLSLKFVLMLSIAQMVTEMTLLWGLNKTDLETESNLKFLLCYITLGHFLLLSPSPAAEDSGICEYHLTSPVLPRSDGNCIFQVALYEAGAAAGNLTLLIKPVLLGSAVHSVILNHRSQDEHRLANILSMPLQRCLWRTVIYFIDALFIQHNRSIKLVSKSKNPASGLIEVLVKLRSSL